MDTIVFHKTTRRIASYVYPRRTAAATATAVRTEVDNVCKSELGGIASDYATVEVPESRKPGMTTIINPDGTVGFVPIPPGPTLEAQLNPLAQPLMDRLESTLNSRFALNPLTAAEKDTLRRAVIHFGSRGQVPP